MKTATIVSTNGLGKQLEIAEIVLFQHGLIAFVTNEDASDDYCLCVLGGEATPGQIVEMENDYLRSGKMTITQPHFMRFIAPPPGWRWDPGFLHELDTELDEEEGGEND